MNATEQWQDLIAENLSVGNVPGSHEKVAVFSALPAGQTAYTHDAFVIPKHGTVVSFRQGELKATGDNMDFAIQGPGFIAVQMPDGSKAYTRDGQFKMNSQGQLITKQGYRVLSDSGNLQFDPNNSAPLKVAADGQVSQGSELKGKITLTEFKSPQLMTAAGGGFYVNNVPNMLPQPATSSTLHQGFIEQANTSPTLAMASMLTAMRMYESNEKVMQLQNDRMGRVITDLSGTN